MFIYLQLHSRYNSHFQSNSADLAELLDFQKSDGLYATNSQHTFLTSDIIGTVNMYSAYKLFSIRDLVKLLCLETTKLAQRNYLILYLRLQSVIQLWCRSLHITGTLCYRQASKRNGKYSPNFLKPPSMHSLCLKIHKYVHTGRITSVFHRGGRRG